MNLIFATSNKNKIKEIKSVLGQELSSQIKFEDIDLDEIQDTDMYLVSQTKSKEGYAQLGSPVLVEDTGLLIEAWNGLPGALIKWFMKTVDNQGIIDMLNQFPNKKASAITLISYYDGKKVHYFEGKIDGVISDSVLGENGFGWDKIFVPDGQTLGKELTFAQMSETQKNSLSMRKLALEKLKGSIIKKQL
jgi:non-canonical purine NTP pyrophosphatase (RdgB/HAM1 family)